MWVDIGLGGTPPLWLTGWMSRFKMSYLTHPTPKPPLPQPSNSRNLWTQHTASQHRLTTPSTSSGPMETEIPSPTTTKRGFYRSHWFLWYKLCWNFVLVWKGELGNLWDHWGWSWLHPPLPRTLHGPRLRLLLSHWHLLCNSNGIRPSPRQQGG